MKQTEALALLKMGKNIFLTGEAGAGKTYLLNQYVNYLKTHHIGVAITASTGIAATHLQGVTIHSWSGMGVRDSLTLKDLEKLQTAGGGRIKRNFKKTKVLIIDEISMLHPHQLEMVDAIARHLLFPDKPFGGLQVILCGDFFQLPPVTANKMTTDETKFAFESAAWEGGDFRVCYLSEQHRQSNDPLHGILNDIRSGSAGEHTKVPLRLRYKKEPEGGTRATKLYCRNINVDSINERELAQLDGDEKCYTMECTGYSALVEGLKKSCLAPEFLNLKMGAEVMFIKNDTTGRYVNGTRCTVIGFDKKNGWPIVKTYDGDVVVAEPEEWKFEEGDVVRARITQVPLRLAWAITIHKSQGLTLDAVEVDLGDAFEPGMGYVALSRVRKLSGLKLMNLNEMALRVHPKILAHDQIFKTCSNEVVNELNALSPDQLALQQKSILLDRFESGKPVTLTPRQRKRRARRTLDEMMGEPEPF